MTTRTKKILIASCLAACLIFLGAVATLWWLVRTGRLQSLIERRVAEATGMSVHMKSLHFSLPLGVNVEELTVALPGRESSPLLSCPRLRISASLGSLLRRRVASVTIVRPRLRLTSEEQAGLKLPGGGAGGTSGKSLSLGRVRIVDGAIDLDLPGVKAGLKGISATLREPLISAGAEKVLSLKVDSGDFLIGQEDKGQIPIALKQVKSRVSVKPMQSTTEIEADVHQALVTTELPHLLLPPDIPVVMSLAADYVPSRDSLENGILTVTLGPFSDIRVYGSVADVLSDAPAPDLNLTVEAPEIARLLEYIELLQRPNYKDLKVAGPLHMEGRLTGTLEAPKLSARVNTRDARFEWEGIVLEGLSVDVPGAYGADGLSAGPGIISADKALIPVEEAQVEATSLKGSVSLDTSRASVSEFGMKLGDVGEVSMGGNYEFASGLFHADARMAGASLEHALGLVSRTIYRLPDDLSAAGTLGFECGLDGKLASALENVSVKYEISLTGGEISSGEFVSAAGLNTKLTGKAESKSPLKLWRFDAEGDAGNFEVLVDTFYKSFSENRFPFSLSGEYGVESNSFRDTAVSLNLGRMGKIAAKGSAQFASEPEIAMRLQASKIDLGEVFKEVAQQVLSEVSPLFRDAEVGGVLSGDLAVRVVGDRRSVAGTLDVADGRVALEKGAYAIGSLSARLPFDVRFPQEESDRTIQFAEKDYGRIALGTLDAGPVHVPSLGLDVALKENALRVKGPISVDVFGGKFGVGDIRGENLFGSSAELTTSLTAENIDIGQVSEELGLPSIAGTLDAQFPSIALTTDSLVTTGAAEINAFGGTIDIASVGVDSPFSDVRTFKADLDFRDIDLSTVTETLDFGSISGIMEGTLNGFEMSQGQPAAFVADFETVPRKGVAQRINFDAVQNITILGTGQGFRGGVGRGLAAFFDEFGYDKIGFYCTLKNDNFRMKGKVVQGDTEYFVKGVRFGPSINVINRNPGQTVSFKSMLERINRIKTKQESEEK